MRRLLLGVGILFVLAADAPDEAAKKDLALMQGTWMCAEGEVGGRPLPDADKKKAKVIIKDNHLTITGIPDAPGSVAFTLNPTKTPKEIDLLPQQPAFKGKTGLGIYAVEENGLKLCLNVFTTDNAQGKDRPAEFSAKGSISRVALVLKKK
jgi:uncharacterized protein (TIGR03067 family)